VRIVMMSLIRVFAMLALGLLLCLAGLVNSVDAQSEVPLQPNQAPYVASQPLEAPRQQPQSDPPTNPSSGSTLEIAPPPILKGCWSGSSAGSDYKVERVGNQSAQWGGRIGSLRFCYKQIGDQFQFTSGKLGLTDYENQQVKNFSNSMKLVATDGKTYVRLFSQSDDDQSFLLGLMHLHVSAGAEIYCIIHGDRLEVSSKSLNQIDGQPWMLITWHGFLDRELPAGQGQQGVLLPQEEPK